MASSRARYLSILADALNTSGQVSSNNIILPDTGVTAGSYGSASQVPVLTVDSKGRITSASTTSVAGVSSFGYNTSSGRLTIGTADGSSFTADVTLAPFTTTNLTEGTNQYFTTARARSSISASGALSYNSTTGALTYTQGNTDTVSEGATNLYFTTDRARGALSYTTGSAGYNSTSGQITIPGTTSHITEGSNLFYTDARARAAISAGTGVSYNSTTGVVSIGQAVGTTDNVTFGNVTVNGTLTSDDITSTNITASGNLIVSGNLTVSGTTTTVNSTTVSVADINIELARNATTAAQANGAGITVTGPTTAATLTYSSSDDRWNLNKNLNVTTVYGNLVGAVTGNASTASALATTRSITITGDGSWTVNFDGSGNASGALTLANSGVTAGSYGSGTAIPVITIDAKGRITSATTSAVTIGDGAMTVTAGTGLSGGGQLGTANQTGASSVTLSLATVGTAGTYTKVTTDAYGRVTSGTTLSASDIPSLSATYLPLSGGTLTGKVTYPSAIDSRPQFPNGILGLDVGDGNFDIWGISRDYYPSHATAANAWGIRWDGDSNQVRFIGGGTVRLSIDLDGGSTGALQWEGYNIWHAGNLTNLNQLINGPGYLTGTKVDSITATSPIVASASTGAVTLSHANSGVTAGTYNNVTVNATGHVTSGSNVSYLTSYTETDTLATVTARGASTSTASTFSGGITANVTGTIVSPNGSTVATADNSMPSAANSMLYTLAYGPSGNDGHIIGMTWTNSTIYGAQIWLDTDPTNRMAIRSRNSSGVWNGWSEVLTSNNISSYAVTSESDTLATVTARGASTSTQSAFNGGLTSSGYTNIGGQVYISGTNTNTLNSGYATAADGSDLWVNYRGYNDGQSYYRNFNIGDGRGNNVAWADGPNKRLSINNGQVASYTLHVNGIGYSSSSFRAPIFYDSDNTATWLDPSVSSGTIMSTGASSDTLGYNSSYGIYIGGINGRYLYSGNSSYSGPVFWNGSAAYTVYHSGNFSESDTLATVTSRGASTSTTVSLNGGAALGDGWLYYNDTDRNPGTATYYPNVQTRAIRFAFIGASYAGTGGNYAGMMQFNPWTGTTASTGDASYQLVFGSTAANGGGTPQLRIRKGIDSTWNSWYDILTSANYNSYSPTLTGGGASGTWGISISGNAATASSVAWTNVSSRPTALSSFTNDSGYITGGYLDDYTRGAYRVIADYSSTNTWYIRSNGRFTWARAHDWTQAFELNIGNGTAASNNGWAELGQNTSNNAAGTWFGTRFVQYTGSSKIDGYVRAGRYYLGDDTNYITSGGAGAMRSQTSTGYIDVGSMNASYAHIQTDRPQFYFNKDVYIDGQLYKYGAGAYYHTGNLGLTLTSSSNGINPDSVTQNQIGYNTSISLFGQTDGGLYSSAYSSSWIHQIYGDFRTGQIAVRGKNSGTWQSWRAVLDASNYTSYTMARDNWNGNLYFNNDGRIYCTILYDANDSGYYLDPNSTSRMYRIDYNNLYYAGDTSYGMIATNGYFDTVNSGYSSDPLELIYVRGNEVRVGPNGGDKPIKAATYYDYADTGYYVDANGTSSLNTVQGYRFATQTGSQSPDNSHPGYGMRPFYSWNIGQANNANAGYSNGITIGSHPGDQAYGFQIIQNMWDDRTYTRRYNGGWQSWRTLMNNVDDPYAWNMNQYVRTSDDVTFNRAYGSADIRSPIFYDNNNTGYYIDPNSYSYVSSLRAASYLASNGNVYIDSNYGYGVVGVYTSTRYQGVFAMGDSYKLPADGTTTGSLYGIAWSHPNAGGVAANLNTHGMLVMENGTFLAAVSGSIRSRDDMRAPIFYDKDDTGYYCNPNSDSVFWHAKTYGGITVNNGYNTGYGINLYSGSGYQPTYGIVFAGTGTYGTHGSVSSDWSTFFTMNDDTTRGWVFRRGSTNVASISGGGNGYFNGNVTAYSDIRVKTNIENITNAVEKVSKLRGVTYDRIDDPTQGRQTGVIAQEVLEVLPEAVGGSEEKGYYVAYGNMIGLLIEAIKEQDDKITRLEALVETLINKLGE